MESTPEQKEREYKSPRWNNNTKLVVALSFVAILAGIFIKFRNFVGPLLLAFILSYLVYPVITAIHRKLRISWRLSVLLVYLLGVSILIGLIVWGGIALLEQVQSLIGFIQSLITNLPTYINQWSHQVIEFGPFEFDLQTLDLRQLTNELIRMIQPLVSQVGSFVGSLAGGAASGIGWAFFILMVSFFVVSETAGNARLIDIQIPGYGEDIKRLGIQLSRIWNAFLRNQVILIVLTVVFYTLMLGVLQIRFYFGLALLAGLARFVPYVGPAIAWTTYGLVAYFQGYTIFGLTPFWYVVLIIGLAVIVDVLIDNVVTPSMMADALKVHPAAVLVAVLVAASLLGVAGVLLAAPVLASAKLITDYAFDKMFDQDPWRNFDANPKSPGRLADAARWRSRFLSFKNKLKGLTPDGKIDEMRKKE